MNDRLKKISEAYDLTVEQHRQGIDHLVGLPDGFRNSDKFREFQKGAGSELTASNAPENRRFLDPQPGMRFLDAGCCANLANYRFDTWPCVYYGVDISPALIDAMKGFATHNRISVGGLEVAELAALPFDENFFDIALVIGVLEYADMDYCRVALLELNRVLRNGSRIVVDIPNLGHAHIQTMFTLEEYLGRPNVPKARAQFEQVLAPLFTIAKADDSRVMLKYFLRAKK